MVGILNQVMVKHQLTINSKAIPLLQVMVVWPMRLKRGTLPHMGPKETLLKLRVSQVMLLDSLAQTQQVIRRKERSQDMLCPQLPKVVMGANLDTPPTMDPLKHRNLQPLPQFTDKHNNHLARMELMVNLLLVIHILRHHHRDMLNQIQVRSGLHHLGTVQQVRRVGMVHLMVPLQQVNQVMVRGCHLTALLMVVLILSRRQYILVMVILQQLSLLNRVELPKHLHKADVVLLICSCFMIW